MGDKRDGMTLERIDNSLGYSKDNCKWATMTEQSRNRRTTKLDEQDARLIKMMIDIGVTQNAIASQFGVSRSNIGHIAQNSTWRTI
jgi:DNA invertase Pin-like site-specific DNA recombinase